jgi:hypothetical protein
MKTLEKIVLHPKLENDSREQVREWCNQNVEPGKWSVNSNYDDHGCFNVTMWGEEHAKMVTDFLMRYPETKVLEAEYKETYEIAPEALSLFDFGD